jgi:hypothetical protein
MSAKAVIEGVEAVDSRAHPIRAGASYKETNLGRLL